MENLGNMAQGDGKEVGPLAKPLGEPKTALVWTREKPKVDGWYWYASGGHTVGIEWVLVSASGRASWINMMTDESEPIPDGLEWAGPIPEPAGSPERAEGSKAKLTCLHGRLGVGDCAICTDDAYQPEEGPQ